MLHDICFCLFACSLLFFFRGVQHVYFAEFMLTVTYNGDIDRIYKI